MTEAASRLTERREAIKAEVAHVTRLAFSFAAFVIYLLIAVGAMDDSYVIRNDLTVELPILDVQVGARAFSVVAPLVLLAFHLYLLRERLILLRSLAAYYSEGRSRDEFLLPWLLFWERLDGGGCAVRVANWLTVVAFGTAVFAPALVLLLLQWRFMASHHIGLTGSHALLLAVDLLLVYLFWRLSLPSLSAPAISKVLNRPVAEPGPARSGQMVVLVTILAVVPIVLVFFAREGIAFRWLSVPTNLTLRSWRSEGRLDLRNADLRLADLVGSDLRGADLRGADLRDANLEGCDLTGARMGVLTKNGEDRVTRLEGANLRGARLVGADLRAASLRSSILAEADLSGAILERARLDGVRGEGVILFAANLRGAYFDGADLFRADLALSSLEGASLLAARLAEATLDHAEPPPLFQAIDLRDASFRGVSGFIFKSVDARYARFDPGPFCAQLETLDLQDATFDEPSDPEDLVKRLDQLEKEGVGVLQSRHLKEVRARLALGGKPGLSAHRENIMGRAALPDCPSPAEKNVLIEPPVSDLDRREFTAALAREMVVASCRSTDALRMLASRAVGGSIPPAPDVNGALRVELLRLLDGPIETCPALWRLPCTTRNEIRAGPESACGGLARTVGWWLWSRYGGR